MLEKCFEPDVVFKASGILDMHVKLIYPVIKEEFKDSIKTFPLKEAILHNQDENVGLTLLEYLSKEAINTELYQECLYLASQRKWWNVFSVLLDHVRQDNDYMKLIVENLVKHNQLNLLQKMTHLAFEAKIRADRSLYIAISNKNLEIAIFLCLNISTFKINFDSSFLSAFKFSPELKDDLICLILAIKNKNPLKMASSNGNLKLAKDILSVQGNSKFILDKDENEIPAFEIAAMNGFWQLVEVYLEKLANEDIKEHVTRGIFYAICGECVHDSDRHILLPNYIPKVISNVDLPSKYRFLPSKVSQNYEEISLFPRKKQDYSLTLQLLLNSDNDIEIDIDSLTIACFYGNNFIIDYIKSHVPQSPDTILSLLTASINGYIYHFTPNFFSFYGSSCSKFIFKLKTDYISAKERKLHQSVWLEFLLTLALSLSNSDLEINHQNKMKFLHVFYICLHYHILNVITPLFSLVNKLEVEPSIYGGILITAARIGDFHNLSKLLEMGANPDWCQTLPSWELVPRYDYEDHSSIKEHEDLGPWSDSDSASIKNEEVPRSNLTATLPTALHWACEKSDYKMVLLLLEYKATKNLQVRLSLLKPYLCRKHLRQKLVTPLDIACLKGNLNIIQILGEMVEDNFMNVFYSGKSDIFIEASKRVTNFESKIKSERLLIKACRYGYTEISLYLLDFYQPDDLLSTLKHKGTGIMHICAINGDEKMIGAILSVIPKQYHEELFNAKTPYGFTPYLLSKYVSKKPLKFLFSSVLTEFSSYLLLNHAFVTSVFATPYSMTRPNFNYKNDTKMPLILALFDSVGSKNIPLLLAILEDNLLIKDLIRYHELNMKEADGNIIEKLYKNAIDVNNL